MRVVVLGGYGNFGARITRALASDAKLEIVVAGRDIARARGLALEVGAEGALVDSSSAGLAADLRRLGAQIVVHTAGPFQGQQYAVAHAAADAGAHYVDLADGRRFVCDFAASLDEEFRSRGLVAITGASTVPALSSAVVDAALARLDSVERIDMCIAPAQRAPRGVATMAGVLSYCGAPIRVWRAGRWEEMHGWADPQPIRFAQLKERRGALCDIPDLELFPARYRGVRDVMFRAALEVGVSQSAFAFIAAARQRGWIDEPARLAGALHRGGKLVDWLGSPDGAMVVRTTGMRAGRRTTWAWHITAPNHHGPEIPCMATILLVRRIAAGDVASGAMACMGLLSLEDFAPQFAKWGMRQQWQEEEGRG